MAKVSPRNETKSDKFKRLATMRVNKAVKAINQIGYLGGAAYESTDKEREQIISALNNALISMTDKLAGRVQVQEEFGFKKT